VAPKKETLIIILYDICGEIDYQGLLASLGKAGTLGA